MKPFIKLTAILLALTACSLAENSTTRPDLSRLARAVDTDTVYMLYYRVNETNAWAGLLISDSSSPKSFEKVYGSVYLADDWNCEDAELISFTTSAATNSTATDIVWDILTIPVADDGTQYEIGAPGALSNLTGFEAGGDGGLDLLTDLKTLYFFDPVAYTNYSPASSNALDIFTNSNYIMLIPVTEDAGV